MRSWALIALLLSPITVSAQWQLQNARTTADLRGIDYVGNGVAWASGTSGTVLHTNDAGLVWQLCAIPPGADHLDFRGIQAFDKSTAIVMSSGRGDLSRLYQTTDGCQTWKLVTTNPDPEGFWGDLTMPDKVDGSLLGGPVGGTFVLHRVIMISGKAQIEDLPRSSSWNQQLAANGRSVLSASSLTLPSGFWRPLDPHEKRQTENCIGADMWFGTSGPQRPKVYMHKLTFPQCADVATSEWDAVDVPITGNTASSGVFSLIDEDGIRLVAVGGDSLHPARRQGTAAYTNDSGQHWNAAIHAPGGFRSAVAYSIPEDTWITVGPNGTDISTDDGLNWHPLKPSPQDSPEADQHWNSLSLPFVVGSHGRIGKLEDTALRPEKGGRSKLKK